MRYHELKIEFVQYVPDALQNGILYISEQYSIAIHNCCCGCGAEVVTPIGPTDWRMTREANLVTLWPSIGSWELPCRSHYFIERNKVVWAANMSDAQIKRGRNRDRMEKEIYFKEKKNSQAVSAIASRKNKSGLFQRMVDFIKCLWKA